MCSPFAINAVFLSLAGGTGERRERLLVLQGLDWVQPRGAVGGHGAEDNPHDDRGSQCDGRGLPANGNVERGKETHRERDGESEQRADNPAGEREEDRLGEELQPYLAPGGAERLADAYLADARLYIGQHAVHDSHASDYQGNCRRQREHPGEDFGDLAGVVEDLSKCLGAVDTVGPVPALDERGDLRGPWLDQ